MRTREIHRPGGHAAGGPWLSVALTAVGVGWLAMGVALADTRTPTDALRDGLTLRSADGTAVVGSLGGFATGPTDGLSITFPPIAKELPPPPPLEATGRGAVFAIVPTPGSGLLLLAGAGLSMRRVALGGRRSRVAGSPRGAIRPEPRLA